MIQNHQVFIDAIHDKQKLRIVFFSEEDGGLIVRVCAPMDYAAGKRIKDSVPRYWVWDYDSDTEVHTLPLRSERIKSIVPTGEKFNPADFVTWSTDWVIKRDWGQFS